MEILNMIKEDTIFIGLDVSSREECIQAMIDGMGKAGFVNNKAIYLEAVNAREQKGSTGVGFGVAIPHGKSSGVVSPGLAFACLQQPIDWNSLDGKPVQIVFMIGVPEKDAGNEHLKILIAISRKLIHEDFRNKLLAVNSSAELYAILESI